jgi:hypothetical protein
MGYKEGIFPLWYVVLSMIGLSLSAIIVDTKSIHESDFIFAAVTLSLSIASLCITTWWMVTSCRAASDSESTVHTTNDCAILSMDLLAIFLSGILLALASIVLSLGSLIVSTSYIYATVVVAVSSLTILVVLGRLVGQARKSCEPRVV